MGKRWEKDGKKMGKRWGKWDGIGVCGNIDWGSSILGICIKNGGFLMEMVVFL